MHKFNSIDLFIAVGSHSEDKCDKCVVGLGWFFKEPEVLFWHEDVVNDPGPSKLMYITTCVNLQRALWTINYY